MDTLKLTHFLVDDCLDSSVFVYLFVIVTTDYIAMNILLKYWLWVALKFSPLYLTESSIARKQAKSVFNSIDPAKI